MTKEPRTIEYNSEKRLSSEWIKENADYHKFHKGKGKILLKDSVTEIGISAFIRCENLTFIEIPDCITEIAEYAFFACSKLNKVEICGSVTKIGCAAFSGCSELESIKIPNSVTEIGEDAFSGCKKLSSEKVILNSVTEIKAGTFRQCSIKSIDIPNVTKIGWTAFTGCSELKSIKIPDSVTVETSAFYGCDNLQKETLDKIRAINSKAFAKWGYVRETRKQADNAERDDGVHRTELIDYLNAIFIQKTDWIHDKPFVKGRQIRPDYRSEMLNLIVEFDGVKHYTDPTTIVKDKKNEEIYKKQGYKIVRIPYFIQLTKEVVNQMFRSVKGFKPVAEPLFPEGVASFSKSCIVEKYPYSPAFLCPAGLKRMAEDFLKYPEQYETNLKALKELNNDELSGVKFLEEAYEEAKKEKSEKGAK